MANSFDSSADRASILGPTLRFKGELAADEDLVIHGQVEGSVGPAPRVTIGPEATVKATVTADVIVIEGKVEGDLKAQTSVAVPMAPTHSVVPNWQVVVPGEHSPSLSPQPGMSKRSVT